MGGVLVELLGDTKSRPAPLTPKTAHDMIMSTRLGRLLQGYRSHPAGDLEALTGLLVKVSEIAVEWTQLIELDLNPVMVRAPGDGVVLVDARARAQ